MDKTSAHTQIYFVLLHIAQACSMPVYRYKSQSTRNVAQLCEPYVTPLDAYK